MSAESTIKLSADEKSFILAAVKGDADTVGDLLAKGVAVDARDSETYSLGAASNITALMCAAAKGHANIVQRLLSAGANVSAACEAHKQDGGGGSQPLHYAMAGGHIAVAAALLDAGADPNAIGRYGRTPLTSAIQAISVEGVRLLLQRGADAKLKPRRKDYDPPLYAAVVAINNHTEIVRRGNTFVLAAEAIWARKPEIFELFKLLLDAGAYRNAPGPLNESALKRLAAGKEMPDDLRIPLMGSLLKAGAKADALNQDGSTALHMAVFYINPQVAKVLCQAGADVNQAGKRGTPLKIAEQTVDSCRKKVAEPPAPGMKPELIELGQKRTENDLQRAESVLQILREFEAGRESEPKAPAPARSTSSEQGTAAALGAKHFFDFIYDGEAEWALLAVKGNIEETAGAFSKLCQAKKWDRNVEVKKTSAKFDELARLIAVVQVKNNPWTVIYWTLFHVEQAALDGVVNAARTLSAELKTKAVAFAAEDTSGAIATDHFDNGQELGHQDFDDGDHDAIDGFFRQQGIYLSACYPKTKGKRSWLAVEKISADTIERADLLWM